MSSNVQIAAFYKFNTLQMQEVEQIQNALNETGRKLKIRGLIIIATEGVNGTVASTPENIENFKKVLQETFGEILFKNASANEQPFKRYFVKIRPEIVTLGDPSVLPEKEDTTHLSPAEFHQMMQEEDIAIIDARNTYETEIGMFEGAIDPGIRKFQDFPAFVKGSGLPKEKKVLMYCTGGIRCEKALVEMKRQGYQNVYQLNGGILKYLEEFPEAKFKGECFVFDHRVAVNQELKPSGKYKLCPHCGDPGDVSLSCSLCKKNGVICSKCNIKEELRTCSKNCAYHAKKSATSFFLR